MKSDWEFAPLGDDELWSACIAFNEAWQADPSEYWQGLVFLSAGFYHLECGHVPASRMLLELAVESLAPIAWADRDGELAKTVANAVALLRKLRHTEGRSTAMEALNAARALRQRSSAV